MSFDEYEELSNVSDNENDSDSGDNQNSEVQITITSGQITRYWGMS